MFWRIYWKRWTSVFEFTVVLVILTLFLSLHAVVMLCVIIFLRLSKFVILLLSAAPLLHPSLTSFSSFFLLFSAFSSLHPVSLHSFLTFLSSPLFSSFHPPSARILKSFLWVLHSMLSCSATISKMKVRHYTLIAHLYLVSLHTVCWYFYFRDFKYMQLIVCCVMSLNTPQIISYCIMKCIVTRFCIIL